MGGIQGHEDALALVLKACEIDAKKEHFLVSGAGDEPGVSRDVSLCAGDQKMLFLEEVTPLRDGLERLRNTGRCGSILGPLSRSGTA